MRKSSIIISTLCLLLALPSVGLAENNQAQTPQSIKVEAGKQVKAAVSSTSIAAFSEDFTGPVLESATVSPTQVGVGETITVTARATDPSEVTRIDAYLNLPDSDGYRGYKILPLVLDNETGEWKGTYTIKDYDLEGTWMIDFDLYDGLGNQSYGEDSDSFEVVNSSGGDKEFPTFVGATVTPLNVAVNQEVTIKANVTDNIGVDRVEAYIYTADSNGLYNVPLTLNPTTNEWEGSHFFSEDDMPGTWYVDIDFFDAAGNFITEMLQEELTLSNPDSDFTGPAIGEAAVTPESASPGESVQISVPVSDEQSGVSSVFAEVFHVDSPFDIKYVYLSLDPSTGQWIGNFNIVSGFQSGVWNVFIRASDNVGNTSLSEFAASFDVINTDGDFDAPIFSSAEVTPQGDVNIGESVTFTAKVSDNVGVDSVYANIYTQGEYEEQFLMSYDPENEQWVGNLDILETTAPGFYQVYFTAYDAALNVNWADAAGGFTVVNPEGDHTGPVISAVELDKTEVNAGEQVTISATVTDTQSEVAEVTAYYYENGSIALTFDSTLNKWVGSITVPKNVPDGEVIKINLVNAVDSKGNSTTLYDAASFQVHNSDGDFILPVVESFEMTPTTVTPGETVHFEAKLVDEKSGIKSATVYLYNDTDPNITMIDLIDSGANDVWTADYVIPATSGLGTYSVGLGIDDNAGNMADYVADQTLLVEEADTTAPIAPSVDAVNDKTTVVSGTTEADADVTVMVGTTEIGSGKADGEGKFSITIEPQTAGMTISVTAKDAAGNASSTDVTVEATDTTAPVAPTVDAINDKTTVISGTTEADADVTVMVGTTEIGSGKADGEGKFSITIEPQTAGTTISVTAKDAAGNASSTDVTVEATDTTAPVAPTVDAINDKTTVVSGTTEADAEITLQVGETVIGSGKADGEGKFSITIEPQTAGTTISVIAKDAAGNASTTEIETKTSFAGTNVNVLTNKGWVGVFGTPSLKGARLGELQLGEAAPLIKKYNSYWYEIQFQDQVGYITTNTKYTHLDRQVVLTNKGWVGVLATPSIKGEKLGNLQLGEVAPIIKKYNSYWYEIQFQGQVGYITTNPVYTHVEPEVPDYEGPIVLTNKGWVGVFGTPSLKGERLGDLQLGEAAPLIKKYNSYWYEIQFNDQIGYITTSPTYTHVVGN